MEIKNMNKKENLYWLRVEKNGTNRREIGQIDKQIDRQIDMNERKMQI